MKKNKIESTYYVIEVNPRLAKELIDLMDSLGQSHYGCKYLEELFYFIYQPESLGVFKCDTADYDYELICSEYEVIELSRGEWTCLINGAKFGNPYIVQPGR